MSTPKLKVHCSYVGTTGYNHHSRDFFRKLSEKIDIKIRNFTIGKNWNWPNDEPHNGEPYLNKTDKKLLEEQVLWTSETTRDNFPIYTKHKNEFEHNIDLVLNETDHYFFYDLYDKPKIAYNVWESTLQPPQFFDKLLEYDQIWVPSQWQADCTIKQGADPNKVKVVPEGVDVNTFYPEDPQTTLDYKDGRFKFVLFGRWDYRKSTKEIIETFLKEFDPSEPVDLIVSIDNPFSGDGHETTEKRLEHYGFTDKRIKVKHFPSREDYITYLKNGHVFVSCARSEGWNLPLIESMACGTPSIYSACSGQMEFAEGKGLPVKILGEKPVMDADYNHFNSSVGNYYEPDFKDLARVMRDAFENYTDHKKRAIEEAKLIHRDFNWDKVAEIGNQTLQDFMTSLKNEIIISFIDGARCEIKGPLSQEYQVKFYNDDTNELVWEDTIKNNMWTAPSYKSFIKWRIEIWENGSKIHEHIFNLDGKRVYIHLDSKSIGDTIAWFPYVEEFRKKHNCEVICSTFHNDWFESQYSKIQFVEPGTSVRDLYSSYGIGWFYTEDNPNPYHHFFDFKSQPLQKTATDILGLKYIEIAPKLKKLFLSPIKEKYVTISIQSTCQAKYWNHPTGWEQIVKHLQSKGYKVAIVDQHRTFGIKEFMNTSPQCDYHFHNKSLEEVMSVISGAEFHIGIGSGLSWIAWALNIPTVLISSFSKPWCEFQTNCIRIYDDSSSSGYFNTHRLDASNWNWYPFKEIKSMEDWYKIETITPKQVINAIDTHLINNAFYTTQKVLVNIISNSLGDTLGCIPYVDKYQQDTQSQVSLKCNSLLKPYLVKAYPNLNFIVEDDCNYDNVINLDYNFNLPLQKGYAQQLGYSGNEYLKPRLDFTPSTNLVNKKYVAFGVHSTAQLKYWNHPKGKSVQSTSPYWVELAKLLRKENYLPLMVEKNELFGINPFFNGVKSAVVKKIDLPFDEVLNYIYHSDFYIGLSSGLSWVAHALGKKVVMISNFTEDWNEFNLEDPNYLRILNKSVCHGCFNKINQKYSKQEFLADWYWCPEHKNTPREFECHKSITPQMVLDQIKEKKWI